MAVDTPARIAVIGAGPIGIETALYARYLGYDVDLIEQHTVGAHVGCWKHVRMFSTWDRLTSPLGRAAIAAQFTQWEPPAATETPTGAEWLEQYLLPLSQTDLIVDSLREQTRVCAVSRSEWLKTDRQVERRDWTLRLLLRSEQGIEESLDADVVIDTSGVLGQPNHFGPGGAPAIGEQAHGNRAWRVLPDILGNDKSRFAGRSSLVVGGGTSAATAVVHLVSLCDEYPDTRVMWLRREPIQSEGPFVLVAAGDPMPGLLELSRQVQAIEADVPPQLEIVSGSWIEQVERDDDAWVIATGGDAPRTCHVDELLALVGYRPDLSLFRELQVSLTPDREVTPSMSDWLDGHRDDAASQRDAARRLNSGEPDFYVLGAKSYGRAAGFFFSEGLCQIRDLFARLGDRADLDLYRSIVADRDPPDGSSSA